MKLTPFHPPRIFRVGAGKDIEIRDCARIELSPDEQVTFLTPSGAEYDVLRKDWGYYATPSLNGRLKDSGLRSALAKGPTGRFYLFLVEAGKEPEFSAYLAAERHVVIAWLDDEADLARLERP